MKKLTKRSLIILGLFTSLLSFANDGYTTIKEKEPKVTNVSFKNVKLGSMLSIKDINGLVIYKESIVKKGAYSKGFDLTALPNGEYYFELDSELKIVIIPFNVVSNQVKFKKEEEFTIFKPNIRVKDDIVYVTRSSNSESVVNYRIYYQKNNDLVYSEKLENVKNFNKIFDFSTSEKGTYLFVFYTEGRKFSKIFKI